MAMRSSPVVLVGFLATACATTAGSVSDDPPPDAKPIAFEQSQAAKGASSEAATPEPAENRVIGHVEGEVITYREVAQYAKSELAQSDTPEERATIEKRALLEVVREKMMYRAARDAGVDATRDEIDTERDARVRELAKSGGTLDALLHELGLTRREYDERIRRDIVIKKYESACIGLSRAPDVRVRPLMFIEVTPQEVRQYYDRNPERFQEPALARYRMLQVKTDLAASGRVAATLAAKERAEAALARLRSGEDWSPVYREMNAGERDPEDGLAQVERGKVASWIEDFAFTQPKGTLSDLIAVGTTFYVLRAEGARPERTVPFEEAETAIATRIKNAKFVMAWREVELIVLDQSSVQPESLRQLLREWLRRERMRVSEEAGLR